MMSSPDPRLVARVIAVLEGEPRTIAHAKRRPHGGGIPEEAGFYVWWAKRGALPLAEGRPHPAHAQFRAFYVGISPARAGTKQRLRGRVISNHVGGNTDGSTFRFALGALLLKEREYIPSVRVDAKGRRKYLLPREQNDDLRQWQSEQLRVTWAECTDPWQPGLEAAVIAHFEPPLNSAENAGHAFHATLTAARQTFRDTARCP